MKRRFGSDRSVSQIAPDTAIARAMSDASAVAVREDRAPAALALTGVRWIGHALRAARAQRDLTDASVAVAASATSVVGGR